MRSPSIKLSTLVKVIDSVRTSWKSYYHNISDLLNHGAELAVKEIKQVVYVFDAALKSTHSGKPIKVNI